MPDAFGVHVERDSTGEVILVDRFPVVETDRWRVVDRWWTPEPEIREFAVVVLDGVPVTLKLDEGVGRWTLIDLA